MNFFLIDALDYSTRFEGSLIITQLEIRTESQLALENEFFSDRRLSPLDTVRWLSYYQPARDSKPDPTRLEFENFFLIDALAHLTWFGGSLIIIQLEIRTESQLALENEFFSDRRLSPLDVVRGLSYYHPARDSKREPTCIGKLIFF
jgi:hypothetical protein